MTQFLRVCANCCHANWREDEDGNGGVLRCYKIRTIEQHLTTKGMHKLGAACRFFETREGKTPAEIAQALYISVPTVRTHRARILNKLSLKTQTDLVKYAIAHGLTSVE